jgi:hypothetical protein
MPIDLSKSDAVIVLVIPILPSKLTYFSVPNENSFLGVSFYLAVPIDQVLIRPEAVVHEVVQ